MEQETLLDLQELYSKGLLIPVIGSGLSMPFGLPDWKKLILDAAEFFHLSSENQDKIEKQLAAYDFLTPVDVITEHGVSEIELQKYVAESMKASKRKPFPIHSYGHGLPGRTHSLHTAVSFPRKPESLSALQEICKTVHNNRNSATADKTMKPPSSSLSFHHEICGNAA